MLLGPPMWMELETFTPFMVAFVQELNGRHKIHLKVVLADTPMEDGRTASMVGTIKHVIKRSMVHKDGNWAEV